ncbi:hypothetical protein GF312_17960 [Candidatus Poribacteria bacterium]|nr:hypothetical protein [Candidatus Poribacteria bacterium]
MTKAIWKSAIFLIFIPVLILQGCSSNSGDVIVIDESAPAAPRGVYSVTGDEVVVIHWYPNQEMDLDGYVIYRSPTEFGDYEEIAVTGPNTTNYVDDDVKNGLTYYYAIAAFDNDGNESDLSPEIVDDTPRPEGMNVTLNDYILEPDFSGFDFSRPDKNAQPFDARGTDIYFGVGTVDGEVSVPYIYTVNDDIGIQDLGYTDSMDDVDVSPTQGFTFGFVEAITGHTYAFLTLDGNYAKIRIIDVRIEWLADDIDDAWMTFDWAYQLQVDNPELAPKKALEE